MIVNAGYRGNVGAAVPKFTYTGQYNQRDDGVVELLTSGTITFLNPAVIDIFCVGGGGAGGSSSSTSSEHAQGGGGGGYCTTARKQQVAGSYQVTIGAGGTSGSTPTKGGSTSFGEIVTAEGGNSVSYNNISGNYLYGGASGGSGGGGSKYLTGPELTGGTDGSDGYPLTTDTSGNYKKGGKGANVTTREFGEQTGKLYAGGGGGGSAGYASSSKGGDGGGGAGGSRTAQATAGEANTGGGGGGGSQSRAGASGGSGIVCFRAAK